MNFRAERPRSRRVSGGVESKGAAQEPARPHSYTRLTGALDSLPTLLVQWRTRGRDRGRPLPGGKGVRQLGQEGCTEPRWGRYGGVFFRPLVPDVSRSTHAGLEGWARLDSNQGPTDYESAALTAELRAPRPRSPAARRAAPSPRRRYQRVRGFDWGAAQPECGPEWRAAPFQEPGWAGTGLREPHMSGRTEDDWGSVADQGDLGTGGSATQAHRRRAGGDAVTEGRGLADGNRSGAVLEHEQTVRSVLEAFNRRDIDAALRVVAPASDPPDCLGPDLRGRPSLHRA